MGMQHIRHPIFASLSPIFPPISGLFLSSLLFSKFFVVFFILQMPKFLQHLGYDDLNFRARLHDGTSYVVKFHNSVLPNGSAKRLQAMR